MASTVPPRFSGPNPNKWISAMEQLMYESLIAYEQYVEFSLQYIEGTARLWVQENEERISEMNWCDLVYNLLWEFDKETGASYADEVIADDSRVNVSDLVEEEKKFVSLIPGDNETELISKASGSLDWFLIIQVSNVICWNEEVLEQFYSSQGTKINRSASLEFMTKIEVPIAWCLHFMTGWAELVNHSFASTGEIEHAAQMYNVSENAIVQQPEGMVLPVNFRYTLENVCNSYDDDDIGVSPWRTRAVVPYETTIKLGIRCDPHTRYLPLANILPMEVRTVAGNQESELSELFSGLPLFSSNFAIESTTAVSVVSFSSLRGSIVVLRFSLAISIAISSEDYLRRFEPDLSVLILSMGVSSTNVRHYSRNISLLLLQPISVDACLSYISHLLASKGSESSLPKLHYARWCIHNGGPCPIQHASLWEVIILSLRKELQPADLSNNVVCWVFVPRMMLGIISEAIKIATWYTYPCVISGEGSGSYAFKRSRQTISFHKMFTLSFIHTKVLSLNYDGLTLQNAWAAINIQERLDYIHDFWPLHKPLSLSQLKVGQKITFRSVVWLAGSYVENQWLGTEILLGSKRRTCLLAAISAITMPKANVIDINAMCDQLAPNKTLYLPTFEHAVTDFQYVGMLHYGQRGAFYERYMHKHKVRSGMCFDPRGHCPSFGAAFAILAFSMRNSLRYFTALAVRGLHTDNLVLYCISDLHVHDTKYQMQLRNSSAAFILTSLYNGCKYLGCMYMTIQSSKYQMQRRRESGVLLYLTKFSGFDSLSSSCSFLHTYEVG